MMTKIIFDSILASSIVIRGTVQETHITDALMVNKLKKFLRALSILSLT
jgi:hypothetical protein